MGHAGQTKTLPLVGRGWPILTGGKENAGSPFDGGIGCGSSAAFEEQIGFPSTREYVRAVLRRAERYRWARAQFWDAAHNSGKSMPIIKPGNSTRKPLTAARRSKNKTMTDSNSKAAIHAITTVPQRWKTSRDGENASVIKTKAKYTTKLTPTAHLNNCFNTFMRIADPPPRSEAPCVHPQQRCR